MASRRWRRRPLEAGLVVAVLALGIGLAGAVWSVAWGTLWRGMDHGDGSRLVRLAVAAPGEAPHRATLPPEIFEAMNRRLGGCELVGAWLPFAVDVGGLDRFPERLNGAMVTAGTLELLGVEPLLGRFFSTEEERQGAPVVVIGERLWRDQLGGTASVLGRTIEIYHQPRTVIGVVAEGVRAPYNQELWYPFDAATARRSPWLQVVGRLEPGASAARVAAELAPLAEAHSPDGRVIVDAFEGAYFEPALRRSLKLALAAVAAVLLITCANAAGLLLTQSLERRGEMAVRHALGARRTRLLRQLLAETTVLVSAAGALGLGVAALGIELYRLSELVQGPYWIDVRLDPVVCAVVLAITVIVGSSAGMWPAWRLAGDATALRAGRGSTGGRRALGWHRALVVLQVTLSVALIAGVWWIVRAAEVLSTPYESLRRGDLVTLQTSVYGSRHAEDRGAYEAFWNRLLAELSELPEVRSAAMAPVAGRWGGETGASLEARPETFESPIRVVAPLVSPGALEVLDAPLLAGRGLRPDEATSQEVALVSRAFADRHLGGSPLGRRVRLGEDGPWRRIVGVAPDLAVDDLGEPVPAVYVPSLSKGGASRTLVLRTLGDVSRRLPEIETAVRRAVARVDPQIGVYWVKTMEEWVDLELRHLHRVQWAFRVFGGVALLLTAAGLYGALSLSVARRRRELALRQALGATDQDLRRGVLASGLALVASGALLGAGLAHWTLGLLEATLGELAGPTSVLAPTVLTLGVIALLAAAVPALRAGGIDPAVAIREE